VVAETEDLAPGCRRRDQGNVRSAAIRITAEGQMAADAPDLGHGKGNLIRHSFSPQDLPHVTWADKRGDIENGFAERM